MIKSNKNRMNGIIALMAMMIIWAFAADAKSIASTAYRCVGTDGQIGFSVTKIEFRNDLTRIYGTLEGRAHTAARIDAMSVSLPDGRILQATDIDGVDFKRYFQWEDEGKIEVEIDFPAMKAPKNMTITLACPTGPCVWELKQSEPQKARKRK